MRHLPAQSSPRPRTGGFTLIEIMVVLGIIILIAAVALPAYRFITGSRSIEGAQNIVAAMVGRARSMAIADQQTRGVLFFLNPDNDRVTMALVGQNGGGDLDQYHGWTMRNPTVNTALIDPAANTLTAGITYYSSGTAGQTQSQVIALSTAADTYNNYLGITRRFIFDYGCILQHTSSVATRPPNATYWNGTVTDLNFIEGTDFQLLPQGVGAHLINSNPTATGNFDRYVQIGCILFDRHGQFTSVPWSIPTGGVLGRALRLTKSLNLVNAAGNYQLYSQFGIVLYDRQTYLNTANAGGPAPRGNSIFGSTYFDTTVYPASYFPSPAVEQAKETWLDNNSLPLIIDRHSGALVKGE